MNIDNEKKLILIGDIEVDIVKKKVINLHFSVLPPKGKVRITAPKQMDDKAIRMSIITRLPWIKKQQSKYLNQSRQIKREYISGESHYFMGKRYKLELKYINEIPTVFIKGKNKITLQVRPKSTLVKRNEVMMDWYRKQLKTTLAELITKWEEKIGVQIKLWEIKQMKTRWGTCNEKKSKIILNLELSKKPIRCIEYIVVHELIHLKVKKHNQKFIELMNKYIPKWKSIKEELNQFILSHEEWNY